MLTLSLRVILAVLLAAQGLTQIAPQIMVVSKAAAAAHDLFKTIRRESKIDALSTDGSKPSECRGDIVFDNVVFAYPSRPNVEVLKGLDLVIPAYKTTAIVGPSGSGKSTIIGLLERWFAPLSGTISLDGRKLEDVNIQWLRTNIRLVQQAREFFSLLQQMRSRASANLAPRNRSYLMGPSSRMSPMACRVHRRRSFRMMRSTSWWSRPAKQRTPMSLLNNFPR